jgi:hypothetical protein
LFGRQNDAALIAYLEANRGSTEYLVAATGSMNAAPLMLATQAPVISIGGFNGGDPAPTADQLEDLVQAGKLRFVLLGGRGGFGRNNERTEWVQAVCTPVDPSAYEGAAASDQGGGFGRGPGGGQLYDCATPPQTTPVPPAG